MLSTRAQRRQETVYEWADMPEELLTKVLEAAGWQEGGLGFSRVSATVRLVCAGWKTVYDALVRRLLLRPETTDEAVGMLVLRFPAVVSLEFKGDTWGVLMDDGLRAVSSLPALTFNLSYLPEGNGQGRASTEHPPGALRLSTSAKAITNLH
jgi:hypothetical protein